MLGRRVADPDGIEGRPGTTPGLGLLDVETSLTRDKTLVEVSGTSVADGEPFRGYEMHMGQTAGPDCDRPLLRFSDGRLDGAISADGRVRGTYVHGLFADDRARASLLAWFGARAGRVLLRGGASTGCLTRWPIIWPWISIWTTCSGSRDEDDCEQHQPLGHAGRAV